MKIILAADHAGFKHKEALKIFLQGKVDSIVDAGATAYAEGDDYPQYMAKAAIQVAEDVEGETKAVIFGGSGQGEAMVANRFPGVRAAVWYGGDIEILKLSRQHNNANVLSIGARFVDEKSACEAVEIWLKADFSGDERHSRRIEQMDNIE